MSTSPAASTPVGTQAPNAALAAALPAIIARFDATLSETKTDTNIGVAPEHLRDLVAALKEHYKLQFDYLRNIAGVDYGEDGMAVKYQLYSFRLGHTVQVTVATGTGHPIVPSITALYPAANWHEREAAEMFGFVFEGHPNLRNLLLEEDLHIHPLLKAHPLQKAEIKQGIEDGPAGFKF